MASKRRMTGILAGASVAVATALLAGGSAKGATTLFSTSFEASDGYTTGNYLTGQPGTGTSFASATTTGVGAGGVGSATVFTYASSGLTPTGSNLNYVGVSDLTGLPAGASAYYYPNLSSFTPVGTFTPIVDVVATIGINTGGKGDALFGLTAFDGTSAGHEVADLQIDGTTGAVTVNNGGTATGFTQSTSAVTFDSYELQLNYSTQTYNVFEAPSGATSFTNEIAANVPFETAATTFSSAGIDTIGAGTGATGYALFDNLSITAVPEPTSASLVLGGLVVAGTRRRRRSSAR